MSLIQGWVQKGDPMVGKATEKREGCSFAQQQTWWENMEHMDSFENAAECSRKKHGFRGRQIGVQILVLLISCNATE